MVCRPGFATSKSAGSVAGHGMRFPGLGQGDPAPGANTIRTFRKAPTWADAIGTSFAGFDQALRETGYQVRPVGPCDHPPRRENVEKRRWDETAAVWNPLEGQERRTFDRNAASSGPGTVNGNEDYGNLPVCR
jgi:hypothetical protein